MNRDFEKRYDPKKVEGEIYSLWLKNDCFKQSEDNSKETFSVIMPPPNVTGRLHMGHALDNTLQDILVRYKRMKGFNTLWVPGLDHSAISTECKVVNMLREKGIKKEDLTREQFLEHAFAWKEKYGNIIVNQVKKLGVSADWDKIKFTMDPSCSRAVKKVFVDLYNEGLIYKGKRIINWCPNCGTSLSDIEVDFCEQKGSLWYIKYYLVDGREDDFVTVATTRPETLLGDVAVAVHPEDERYKKLVGRKVLVPIVKREVPVIADDFVEKDYGTGAVKITPAHDINDFEVGLRHNLEFIDVISKKGTMLKNTGRYAGLNTKEARQEILKDLKLGDCVLKVEDINHNVGKCYRCSCNVEPLVSVQWFVKTKNLAKPAIDCVNYREDTLDSCSPTNKNMKCFGENTLEKENLEYTFLPRFSDDEKLTFLPKRFSKTYLNWLFNIRDWCISRQIWWGHRIPAYYCKDCGEMMVSENVVEVCAKCKSKNIYQDEDTLDTWFSSGLWPFSVFDWPKKTSDYDKFFPTSVLVTGYDIIFFWVARMVMLSLKFTGKAPFKYVLIHGLLRDNLGRKMSKSLGNGIDPLDVIDKFGADALRFMLVLGSTMGNDIRFSEEKLTASRNFVNKLFNAARYIYLKVSDNLDCLNLKRIPENLHPEDEWVLGKLNTLIKDVERNLDNFDFGIALNKIYDFVWDIFCDWYIELSKVRLENDLEDIDSRLCTKNVLVFALLNVLKLLHPFVPFVTENLWQIFTEKKLGPLMLSNFPVDIKVVACSQQITGTDCVIDIIKAIRKRRKELNVPAGKILSEVFIESDCSENIKNNLIFIKRLARISSIKIVNDSNLNNGKENEFSVVIAQRSKIYIKNSELFDKDEEVKRLKKELEKFEKELEKVNAQLGNREFLNRAPSRVIERMKELKVDLLNKVEKIKDSVCGLEK